MLKTVLSGVCAGVCITLGGSVYLACEDRAVGALFFSVALLCICYQGYALFTGRVGFLPEKHTKKDFLSLLLCLFGNLLGTAVGGFGARFASPALHEAAQRLCDAKLTIPLWQVGLRAVFCGVLMYLAVSIFRDHKTPLAIFFCIPAFILSGWEHSIADLFYFFCAGAASVRSVWFIALVLAGNAAGGVLLPLIQKGAGHEKG